MSDDIIDDDTVDDGMIPAPTDDVVLEPTTGPRAIDVLAAAAAERRTARRENWRVLRRQPGFIIGCVILIFWVACAVFGKRITPYDPFTDLDSPVLSPRGDHWMGTDKIGRDVMSRVMAGSRDVLVIAPLAAFLGVVFGTVVGLLMGYLRGITDLLLSRVVEAFLSLPVILIGLVALVTFGSSKLVVVLVIAVLFTPIVAKTVRAAVLAEADLDYVTSARLRGESAMFIMVREILPNIAGPIVVEFTVRVGYAIFTVATLSFLGVGIQRPSPDWGLAISEGRDLLNAGQWWPSLFPALAIASLVIAVNLIADALQTVYDR